MMLNILFAGIISGAFGIIFNIRGKAIYTVAANGLVGYAVFQLSLHHGFSTYIAMLFASLVMSLNAEIIARILKMPASLFLIAALIPIIPGGGIYQFAMYLIQGLGEEAVVTAMTTLMETGGIALGVIIVSSVIKLTPRRASG